MDSTTHNSNLSEEEAIEIADKVRTGEYFREARSMYDLVVHDPMSERYIYIIITAIAAMTMLIAVVGLQGLHPLQTDVPFAVESNDLVDELPRIKSLLAEKGEPPNEALLRFLVHNYVKSYEEYDIETFDRNIGTVKSQSTEAVYREYQRLIDPSNPESPLTLYQRHSTRSIEILSSSRFTNDDAEMMEVVFEATISSKSDVKKMRWQANISFKYTGIELDEETGKVRPYEFQVTNYSNKRLQDIR